MGRCLASYWGAGAVSLPFFLLPAWWNTESDYWIVQVASARVWAASHIPEVWAAPHILDGWYLLAAAMHSVATVPSVPNSLNVVEWDLFFADAASDFAVHEDIAAHCGDFCETRPLDAGRPELQSHLSALMQLPALNLFENKLYRHYYLARMGVPIPDLLYAGTVDPLAADLGLPVFNESAFALAALASLSDTGFVLKPLNCELGRGVVLMDRERWLAENMTAEALTWFAHEITALPRDSCSPYTRDFSVLSKPPPPCGVILHRRYAAASGGTPCTGSEVTRDHIQSLGLDSSCLPMEFRAWVVFGRLYAINSYTKCGSMSNPFFMYADGRGGWPACGPLSADPVDYENCELPVHDQRLCRTALQSRMPEIKRLSEKLARSTGLDCLRADWFLGGPDGLQLNEVSYGPMGSLKDTESLEEVLWSQMNLLSESPISVTDYRIAQVMHLAYAKLGLGSANSAVQILPRATVLKRVGCSETDHADLPILCH
mmetsp:Transcript_4407/g.12879  ORF Transcript_4407/g.12879 Transcript_4407/m.12879 type:complete len:488 (+) Transcript_4407:39-1502(+)